MSRIIRLSFSFSGNGRNKNTAFFLQKAAQYRFNTALIHLLVRLSIFSFPPDNPDFSLKGVP
jgi:hypothetical protein